MHFQIRGHWKTSVVIKEFLNMEIQSQCFYWKQYQRLKIVMPCSALLLIQNYSTGNHWFWKQKSKLYYGLCFWPTSSLIIEHLKAKLFWISGEGFYCLNHAETTLLKAIYSCKSTYSREIFQILMIKNLD